MQEIQKILDNVGNCLSDEQKHRGHVEFQEKDKKCA